MPTYTSLAAQLVAQLRQTMTVSGQSAPTIDEGYVEQCLFTALTDVLDRVDLDQYTLFDQLLATTAAGTRTYALPANFRRPLLGYRDQAESGFILSDGTTEYPLWYEPVATLVQTRTNTQARPRRFALTASGITLDPLPDSNSAANYTVRATYIQVLTYSSFVFSTEVPLLYPQMLLAIAQLRYLGQDPSPAIDLLVAEEQRHRLETQWAERPQRMQGAVSGAAARTYADLMTLLLIEARAVLNAAWQPGMPLPRVNEGRLERCLVETMMDILDEVDLDAFTLIDQAIATTATGTRTYALPTTFRRLLLNARDQNENGLRISDGTSIFPLWHQQMAVFNQGLVTTNARPRRFVLAGTNIVVDPPPDSNSTNNYTIRGTYIQNFDYSRFDLTQTMPFREPQALQDAVLARYLGQPSRDALQRVIAAEQRHTLETQWADLPQRYEGAVSAPAPRTYADLLTLAMPDIRTALAAQWQPGMPLPRVNEGHLERCLVEVLMDILDRVDLDAFTLIDQTLATTATGTRAYTLPTTFRRLLLSYRDQGESGVRVSDGTTVFPLWQDQMATFTADLTTTNARPRRFVLTGTTIQVDPPPDSNSAANYTLKATYIQNFDYSRFDLTQTMPFREPQALQDAFIARYLGIDGSAALERVIAAEQRHTLETQWADRPQRYLGAVGAYAGRTYRDIITALMPDVRAALTAAWQPGIPPPRVNEGRLERCLVEVLLQLSDMADLEMLTLFDQTLFTTASGTRSYTLPVNFGRLLTFREPRQTGIRVNNGTNEYDLRYEPMLDLVQGKSSTNGVPGRFVLTASGMTLDPPPDSNNGSNYTVHGTYIEKIDYATFDLTQQVRLTSPQYLHEATLARYLGGDPLPALSRIIQEDASHKVLLQWQYHPNRYRRWRRKGRR